MTIPAVGGISAAGVGASAPVTSTTPATSGTSGGSLFAKGLDQAQGLVDNADSLAQQLASGQLTDLSQYTAAAAKASLAVQLTVALRDKAVEAYQSIMGMQV